MKSCFVRTIGSQAQRLLARPQTASLLGTTSKGLFLRLSVEQVVFLTTESYHGPLTLNLPATPAFERPPEADDPVQIAGNIIEFPASGLVIRTQGAVVWEPPDRRSEILAHAQREALLSNLVERALSLRPGGSLSGYLPFLLNLHRSAGDDLNDLQARLLALQTAIRTRNWVDLQANFETWLGWGSGLTPSGDDLMIGFFLALSRWGGQLIPNFPLQDLAQAIVPAAYGLSPLLSASLIECAAQGMADERLLVALDGLATGEPGPDACLDALLAWGNSSGLDVLCGMVLILI